MNDQALLTFSIGPVHTFIGQARRIADLWAGSRILSLLAGTAIETLHANGIEPLFPSAKKGTIPRGLPNRVVAEVPLDLADRIARDLEAAVHAKWAEIVAHAVKTLRRVDFPVSLPTDDEALWPDAISCAWSWVAEDGDYLRASRQGADLFAASRVFRPFSQNGERGMKCAICGERNALPDGNRERVRSAWEDALERAETRAPRLTAYLREGQARLCLVCAAKRLHPYGDEGETEDDAMFLSFQKFQADDLPYFALVTMDGDRLGDALRGEEARNGDELRDVQQRISAALNEFAEALKEQSSSALSAKRLAGLPSAVVNRKPAPQLIYAGGEDVLFVCDPRDALLLASAVRDLYRACFKSTGLDPATYTISAAVVFAHTKAPAGLLLRDADDLLVRKAKGESNRDSVAIALYKRGGRTVETVFRWSDPLREGMNEVVAELRADHLASRQTYSFAEEGRVLSAVFQRQDDWTTWLRSRLAQGARSREEADRLATMLAPFFVRERADAPDKTDALRIARFLAVEVEPERHDSRASRKRAGAAG